MKTSKYNISKVASPLAEALQQTSARKRARHTLHQRGMTLLEVILAIAVAGFVLAAATSFVVSVSRIWMDREERNFFEDHVDGVTEFLRAAFSNAGVEITLEEEEGTQNTETSNDPNTVETPQITLNIEGNSGDETDEDSANSSSNGGLIQVAEEPVSWSKPPGFADYRDPLLNFKLNEPPPLFVNIEDAPTVGIEAFLHFEKDEGLSLLWYSPLQEETEDLDDLRRTQISPLVTAIHYIYWDERFEKWDEEKEPKEGDGNDQYIIPRFLKLTFEYEGETKERTLTIPVPSNKALIF
jgi:prepilin-type N-terminal cleavage/methylation domain-containing protein